jgi:hypothetical protein
MLFERGEAERWLGVWLGGIVGGWREGYITESGLDSCGVVFVSVGLKREAGGGARGEPSSGAGEVLELVRGLSEEERRFIEELKEERKHYYLGYVPGVYRFVVNV